MPDRPLILIDGECSLCSRVARFIIEHEAAPVAAFCALQTPTGRRLLDEHGLTDIDSIVVIEGDQALTRSRAALRIARLLTAPWSWVRILALIPRPLRDWGYDRIAANRYRVWGRRDACSLPHGVDRSRFIDADELAA